MKKLSNLIYIVPLICLLCLEVSFNFPGYLNSSLAILVANLLIVASIFLFKRNCQVNDRVYGYIIFPVLLLDSLVIFSFLSNEKLLVHGLYFLSVILIYLYLRFVYFYLVKPHLYTPSSIENISSYGNLLTVFWASSALYGLQSFLNIPVWQLAIVYLPALGLVVYQVFWASNVRGEKAIAFTFVDSLLLLEIVWVVSLLPFNYNISGFIIAVCYYMLVGLTRLQLSGKMEKKYIKMYLGYGLFCILLVLLTAQWI